MFSCVEMDLTDRDWFDLWSSNLYVSIVVFIRVSVQWTIIYMYVGLCNCLGNKCWLCIVCWEMEVSMC